MFENPEVLAIIGALTLTAVGIVVVGVKFVVKKIDAIVKASETKIDDKIWRATKTGLREALSELAAEAEAKK